MFWGTVLFNVFSCKENIWPTVMSIFIHSSKIFVNCYGYATFHCVSRYVTLVAIILILKGIESTWSCPAYGQDTDIQRCATKPLTVAPVPVFLLIYNKNISGL